MCGGGHLISGNSLPTALEISWKPNRRLLRGNQCRWSRLVSPRPGGRIVQGGQWWCSKRQPQRPGMKNIRLPEAGHPRQPLLLRQQRPIRERISNARTRASSRIREIAKSTSGAWTVARRNWELLHINSLVHLDCSSTNWLTLVITLATCCVRSQRLPQRQPQQRAARTPQRQPHGVRFA